MKLPKSARRGGSGMLSTFVTFMLFLITKCLYMTLRVKIDPESRRMLGESGSSIMIVWHNRISMMPYVKTVYRNDVPTVGLVSASKDGEFLKKYFSFFNIDAERGSSKRNGARAAINLIRHLRNDRAICITPDGPRGPKYKSKDGILLVCSKVDKARMMFLRIDIDKYWELKSWDRFQVPKFFSKVNIKVAEFDNFIELEKSATAENKTTLEYCDCLLGT